jgi:hypothetical protein
MRAAACCLNYELWPATLRVYLAFELSQCTCDSHIPFIATPDCIVEQGDQKVSIRDLRLS